jgi:hypothetical protein
MAFFVLIALVAALIIYISLAPRKKRALVISAVILGSYLLYVRLACGPDPRDVKVMKPMAEAISSYIIKHGVPKSLQDISGLPYRLEECEREEEYSVFDKKLYKDVKVKQKNEATYKSIEEECLFSKSGRTYYLQSRSLFDLVNNTGGIIVEIGNKESLTWIMMDFDFNKNGLTKRTDHKKFHSSKDAGICNPMRQ